MPKVVLERDSGYADRIRKYRVLVDGTDVGAIGNGGRFEHELTPGPHTLQVRIDWAKTEVMSFDAGEGDARFFVRSGLRGWKVLLASLYMLMPSKWIALERIDGSRVSP